MIKRNKNDHESTSDDNDDVWTIYLDFLRKLHRDVSRVLRRKQGKFRVAVFLRKTRIALFIDIDCDLYNSTFQALDWIFSGQFVIVLINKPAL